MMTMMIETDTVMIEVANSEDSGCFKRKREDGRSGSCRFLTKRKWVGNKGHCKQRA